MTKIGYRFIIWALLFLIGFILYEFNRDIDGMEGTIISECLKTDGYDNDYYLIDLDDSFMYALIEKDDNSKIGDRIKIKCPNERIINKSYDWQACPLIIFIIACGIVVIFSTALAMEGDWIYEHLKD